MAAGEKPEALRRRRDSLAGDPDDMKGAGTCKVLARARRGTAWIALAILVSACTVGPDFARPEPPATKVYTKESGSILSPADAAAFEQHVAPGRKPAPEWWKEFRSHDLDQVIDQAVAANRTLAAARSSLAQAREAVIAAEGALYPQVDFAASAGAQKYGAAFLGTTQVLPAFGFFELGPSVSYALDVFGGTKRRIEGEEALAAYQAFELEAAVLMLTGNVVGEAIAIASVRAQIKAVEDILEDDEKNLELVGAARAAGAVSDVDVLSAESQLANDRTLLPPLRQQESVARHALAILAGKAPGDWSPPEFELAQLTLPRELPLSLPSELVHDRPDIMAAEAQLHAASAAVGVATANLYPQITLTSSLTQQALDAGHLFTAAGTAWSVIGGLTAPIFHGGELEAERRAAVEAYKSALAQYEETVLQAFGQVADVLRALAHDAEQLAAQRHALESAGASLRLTRVSYSAGSSGILQVLDAERLYAQARLGYARADAQRYDDTARLFLALGGAVLSGNGAPAN